MPFRKQLPFFVFETALKKEFLQHSYLYYERALLANPLFCNVYRLHRPKFHTFLNPRGHGNKEKTYLFFISKKDAKKEAKSIPIAIYTQRKQVKSYAKLPNHVPTVDVFTRGKKCPFFRCVYTILSPRRVVENRIQPRERVFVTISHFWSLYTTASTNNNNCMRTAHRKLTMTPHHHHQHFTTCLFADHSTTISHTTRDPIIMRRKKIPFNEFKSFEIDYAK